MLDTKNCDVLRRLRQTIDTNMSEEQMIAELKRIATVLSNDRLETWISEFSFDQQKNGPKVVHEYREDSHEHNDERNDEVVDDTVISEVSNINPEMLMLTKEQMDEDERLRTLFSQEPPEEDESVTEVVEEAIPDRIIEFKRKQFFNQEYKELLETIERMQRMDDFNNEVEEKEVLVGIYCCCINDQYKPFIRLEKETALDLAEAGVLTGTQYSVIHGYTQLSTTDYDGDVDINWNPLYLDDFSNGDIVRQCLPGIPEIITMEDFINNRTRGMGQAEIIQLVEQGEIKFGGDTSRTGNHDPNIMTQRIKHGRYDNSLIYNIQELEDEDHPSMKGYSYRNWEEQRYHYEKLSEKLDHAETLAELQEAMSGYLFSTDRWEIPNNALTTEQRDRLKRKWKRRRAEIADIVIDKLQTIVLRQDDLREAIPMLIPDKWAAIAVAVRGSELRKETGVNHIEPRCWKIIQMIAKDQFISNDKLINGEKLIDQLRNKEKQAEQCSQDEALAILSYAKEMLVQKNWKLLKPETFEKLTSIVKGQK